MRSLARAEQCARRTMNTNARLSLLLLFTFTSTVAACGDDASAALDGGTISPPPSLDVRGRFEGSSTLSLTAVPPQLMSLLTELDSATDGPDDPSRYLVDLVVATLPESELKSLAEFLSPSIAAYAQEHVGAFAPRLASGLRALTTGLTRIATRFGTREVFTIDDSQLQHTITALDFDGRIVGTAEIKTTAMITHTAGVLAIADHAVALDVADVVRLGFHHAVIPSVVPGVEDLGEALATLVDCEALGGVIADQVGFGAPAFASACRLGLSVAASEFEAQLPASVPVGKLRGQARAVDTNRDWIADSLEGGAWQGEMVRGTFHAKQ